MKNEKHDKFIYTYIVFIISVTIVLLVLNACVIKTIHNKKDDLTVYIETSYEPLTDITTGSFIGFIDTAETEKYTNKTTIDENTDNTRGPVTAITQVTTAKPAVTAAPVSTEKPAITTAPVSTVKPAITTAPVSTTSPATTTAPVITAKLVVATAPVTTAKLAVTTAPVTTAKPAVTVAPVTTAKPAVTSAPVTSAKPAVTAAPVTTAKTDDKFIIPNEKEIFAGTTVTGIKLPNAAGSSIAFNDLCSVDYSNITVFYLLY
ncbi:MAG: hypothetical protein ACYCWE_17310 [Eubacteriales bacterium]